MISRIFIIFLLFSTTLCSQEPLPFAKEVKEIVKRNDSLWDPSKETIVFTGSSSIRFWTDLQERFPEHHVLNAGFGGSQTSDLINHLDDLVLKYRPKKVFIYEGDNDIFEKKRPRKILEDTKKVLIRLKKDASKREIVLISAKPSLSRWKLKGRYKRLNRLFNKLALQEPKVSYVDVWTPMLSGRKVREDIFIEDGLHMNTDGYDIWYEVIKDFME